MTLKLYKTRQDQLNKTPIIYENISRIIDQTNDNEIDILINEKWLNITNRNDYFLIIIENQ